MGLPSTQGGRDVAANAVLNVVYPPQGTARS